MNKDGLVTQIDCVAMLYTRYSFFLYIQNGSAKLVGENNMKNTAGLPNGWGAQPQRVCSVSQSSNTKKGDRSLPKIN